MALRQQDFTIFSPDNDDLPLVGTVDGSGVVTDPSFSTDAAHARPWLKFTQNIGASEVNFRDGSAALGLMTLELVDKRTNPNDQATGYLTALAATAAGDTALLGSRIIFRDGLAGGTLTKVFEGVITSVKLLTGRSYVTYQVQLRDIRERERKTRLFTSAKSTTIFPVIGPADGYGYQTQWDGTLGQLVQIGEPAMPPVKGWEAAWHDAGPGVGSDHIGWFDLFVTGDLRDKLADLTDKYGDLWHSYGELSANLSEGNFSTGPLNIWAPADPTAPPPAYRYSGIIVEWSEDDGATWHTVEAPSAATFFFSFGGDSNTFVIGDVGGRQCLKTIKLEIPKGMTPPTILGTVRVRVRSNRAPTTEVPLYVEEPAGEFYRKVYDGEYSDPGLGPDMPYDAARADALMRQLPFVLGRITAPAEDARSFMQEQFYKLFNLAPTLRNGILTPISGAIPDATVTLPVLDNSKVYRADWEHGSGEIVNQVVMEYERDLIPADFSTTGKVITQKLKFEYDRIASQVRHGAKPLTFKPVLLRSVIPMAANVPMQTYGDVAQETALVIFKQRADEAIRRFANGGQMAWAECRPSQVGTIKEGDWVVLAVSWLPDYATRRRGISRLMQVTKIEKSSPIRWRFTLSDAGPFDQPVPQPSLSSPVENSDGSVTVQVGGLGPVTAVSLSGRAEVQYAYGETQPDTDSGEWKTAGYGTVNRLTDPGLENGGTGWTFGAGFSAFVGGTVRTGTTQLLKTPSADSVAKTNEVPVRPGERWFTEGWVNWDAGVTGSGLVGLSWYDASHVLIERAEVLASVAAAGVWGKVTLSAVAPAGAAYVATTIRTVGHGAGNWHFDDFVLNGGATPNYAVTTPINPSGVLVWLRVRGVADGMRPSAWTNPISLRLAGKPRIRDAAVAVMPGDDATHPRQPVVEWSAITTTGGVRIYWEVFAAGAPVPTVLTNSDDYDADDSLAYLPPTLLTGERIAVQLEPWTGWSGSAVSGTAGDRTRVYVAERTDADAATSAYVPPVIIPAITRTSTDDTLTLSIVDTQGNVTQVRFRHRAGLGGAWSAWAVDASPPYSDTVAIVTGEASAVEYEVSGVLADGTTGIIEQRLIEIVPPVPPGVVTYPPPTVQLVSVVPGGTGLFGDVTLRVEDPRLFGGTLYVWVNGGSTGHADPTASPDGSVAIANPTPRTVSASTVFNLTGGGTGMLLDNVTISAAQGKRIYSRFVASDGRDSLIQEHTLLSEGAPFDSSGALKAGSIANAAQFAAGLKPVEVYAAPLPARPTGTIALNTTDNRLYKNTGGGAGDWVAIVNTGDLAGQIGSGQIADLAVLSTKLADNAVATAKLADSAVTNAKLVDDAVTAVKLSTGSVITAKLADGAVDSAKLADLAVTNAKLVADAVTAAKLATDAVTNAKIQAGAVVAGKIAADAVTSGTIAAGAVTAGKVAALSISAGELAADSVIASKIATDAVVAAKIQAGAVVAGKIAADAVTSGTIAANAVTAGKIAANAVTATEIAAGSITTAKIVAGAVTATELASGSVTTAKLVAGAITSTELASDSIIAGKVAAGAIQTSALQAGAVTAVKISLTELSEVTANAGIITAGKLQSLNGKRFLDLNATGTNSFLEIKDDSNNMALKVTASGAAEFYGDVYSTQFKGPSASFGDALTIGAQSAGPDPTFTIRGKVTTGPPATYGTVGRFKVAPAGHGFDVSGFNGMAFGVNFDPTPGGFLFVNNQPVATIRALADGSADPTSGLVEGEIVAFYT